MSDEKPVEEIIGWDGLTTISQSGRRTVTGPWWPRGEDKPRRAEVDDLLAWLTEADRVAFVTMNFGLSSHARCEATVFHAGTGLAEFQGDTLRDALVAAVREVDRT